MFKTGVRLATPAARLAYYEPMNAPISCPPDYSTFSIEDFEQTYDLLRAAMLLAGGVVCATTASGRSSPAARFAELRLVNPASDDLAEMINYLRSAKFPCKEQRERAKAVVQRFDLEPGNRIAALAA